MIRFWLLLAIFASGCGSAAVHAQPADREGTKLALRSTAATGSCGRELWSIKSLTDGYANQVDLSPRHTTIATLTALPAPGFSYTRPRDRNEEITWRLIGTRLTGWKLESDSDYHLVLKSPSGKTMIAEIPDPSCMDSSRVTAQVMLARHQFERMGYNAGNECFDCTDVPIVITGVGFFDVLHGQHGVAPNGIELHPVLSIRRMNASGL